ncbi:hypothetical protein CAT723_02810 [Corynebacterium ammoniagenes]|uniref:Uncharacterized protein n=1 Tax=Corynebacterium ammoniagenes TaxID=1697 RepID=A0AAV5G675_CORAM|nr:hypothetical protein CAT723_02810 [Corynebacterium ammoniagenes]
MNQNTPARVWEYTSHIGVSTGRGFVRRKLKPRGHKSDAAGLGVARWVMTTYFSK